MTPPRGGGSYGGVLVRVLVTGSGYGSTGSVWSTPGFGQRQSTIVNSSQRTRFGSSIETGQLGSHFRFGVRIHYG
ncbi:hypothetical protein HanRHA438_Chr08g0349281 [Helianthus annuus]|nr:hypothetical protein HanRHA438_Chr08g0349281 [Helianthus annuus]